MQGSPIVGHGAGVRVRVRVRIRVRVRVRVGVSPVVGHCAGAAKMWVRVARVKVKVTARVRVAVMVSVLRDAPERVGVGVRARVGLGW